MSAPSSPALQPLHRLDTSSPDFRDQLLDILYGGEYTQHSNSLERGDFVWLIDYLDRALENLDPSSQASRKCLRELRFTCGAQAMLPTSYTLPSQLLEIDSMPFGSGGSGDVYMGTLDGSKVCVRRIRKYIQDVARVVAGDFYKAAITWKHLAHPNVLPLLGVTISPFQLVSKWAHDGNMLEYIKTNPNTDRLGLLCGAAEGLRYLHSRSVIHGDLKGSNILVEDSGHVLIADFGLAKITKNMNSLRSASTQNGFTMRWVAPEVWTEGDYSEKADIFSFAMVMIEAFTGAIPFPDHSPITVAVLIAQGERPPRPTHPTLTNSLWELMQRCWDGDPGLRPEISEVLHALRTPDPSSWKRLISDHLSVDERIPLIMSIFSNHNEVEVIGHLSGDDAQTFVDVVYEVLDSLAPRIRRRCLRSLYRICSCQALLPKSLQVQVCYDPADTAQCRGGFADVWKGQHNDQVVAIKALRVYKTSNFEVIRKQFCREVMIWDMLRHPNVLPLIGVTMSEIRFVMVSEWMENGNVIQYLKNVDADRVQLLMDVAKGLVYLHKQGVVHGDLKGLNIMIDNTGRAVLADFSLVTFIPDHSTFLSSCVNAGTFQSMSPELLVPEKFGLPGLHPTRESDCYALGMVIYEILSGCTPFGTGSLVILYKILEGQRPSRPQGEAGERFTDDIWDMVERCWKTEPRDRPSAKDVLRCLNGNSPTVDSDSDQSDAISINSRRDELGDVGSISASSASIAQVMGQPPDPPDVMNPNKKRIGDRLARLSRNAFAAATNTILCTRKIGCIT